MPRNIPIPGFAQSYPPNFNAAQTMGYMGISNDELIALDLTKNDGMGGFGHGGDQFDEYGLHLNPNEIQIPNGTLDSGYAQADSPFTRPYHQFRHMHSLNGATIETPSSYTSQMSR